MKHKTRTGRKAAPLAGWRSVADALRGIDWNNEQGRSVARLWNDWRAVERRAGRAVPTISRVLAWRM